MPDSGATPTRRRAARIYAYVVSVVLLGAILEPLRRETHDDGFPLSTYPMFSRARPSTEVVVRHVVAFSTDGNHRLVPPELLGTEEVMQAVQTVKIATRQGRSQELCDEVAKRVAGDPKWADIHEIQVRGDRYDVIRYFTEDRRPLHSQVYAACKVGGGEEA